MPEASRVIHRDPEIMSGSFVFVGTRVPFRRLLDYLEAGAPLDEFPDRLPDGAPRTGAGAPVHRTGRLGLTGGGSSGKLMTPGRLSPRGAEGRR